MSYLRVIPRDLFNEASLLKCYGRLWVLLDNMNHTCARLGDEDGEHTGEPFHVVQNDDDGSLTVANVPFTIHGYPYRLHRPLNSRQPWPLYATDENHEETSVFTEGGDFTPEFLALIGA